jgi:hypothetical protein
VESAKCTKDKVLKSGETCWRCAIRFCKPKDFYNGCRMYELVNKIRKKNYLVCSMTGSNGEKAEGVEFMLRMTGDPSAAQLYWGVVLKVFAV